MVGIEILEYNKRCAEFLGWRVKFIEKYPYTLYLQSPKGSLYNTCTGNNEKECWENSQYKLKFHSDWNWIHELVEKISKSRIKTQKEMIPNHFSLESHDSIMPYNNIVKPIKIALFENNKQAVVQAINQFLIWYDENKKE